MKKLFFVSALLFSTLLQVAAQEQASVEISFNEQSHDFGTLNEGESPTFTFIFTNTGTEPLQLSSVRTSCNCVTVVWTKEPVAPGKTGTIKATYLSADRPGTFHKSITVESNARTTSKILTVKGNVLPKPE